MVARPRPKSGSRSLECLLKFDLVCVWSASETDGLEAERARPHSNQNSPRRTDGPYQFKYQTYTCPRWTYGLYQFKYQRLVQAQIRHRAAPTAKRCSRWLTSWWIMVLQRGQTSYCGCWQRLRGNGLFILIHQFVYFQYSLLKQRHWLCSFLYLCNMTQTCHHTSFSLFALNKPYGL